MPSTATNRRLNIILVFIGIGLRLNFFEKKEGKVTTI